MIKNLSIYAVLLAATSISTGAQAQSAAPEADQDRASDAISGDIIVTATKKRAGEQLQQVPISAAAYGQAQLEALQFKNLTNISLAAPNIQLDAVGTSKGTANFTIRGVGVNNSTPSIEPTVGTFVDGVYLGTNYGVILDTFDVESIEVLRGPQGVLFGRNVTGGAVSIRTRRPDGTFAVKSKMSIESGLRGTGAEKIAALSVEGTLVPDTVFAKLTGYYSQDGGYFKNTTLGRSVGRDKTWFLRPTIVLQPTDSVEITFIGETGLSHGDGPVVRNPAGTVRSKDFETASNFAGKNRLKHNSATVEVNVDAGSGRITNIFGYRDFTSISTFDVDASSQSVYNLSYFTKQNQFSNELRYANRLFDKTEFVTGLYYFHQDIFGLQRDDLVYLGRYRDYGGEQKQDSFGIFVNTDTDVTDKLTIGIGARYSVDKKDVKISRAFLTPAAQPCDFDMRTCTYEVVTGKTFKSFTPRLAVKYQFTPETQAYASFTRGYRSGGYNIRSSAAIIPGPFDDETADAYEIGLKSDLFDRRVRFNIAAFLNNIHNIQRSTTTITPTGSVSVLNNAGNDRLKGLEGEVTVKVADGFVIKGSLGYTHGRYTKITADINADGVIDARDKALKLPRLSPWTYGAAVFYDTDLGNAGSLSLQAQFSHRDAAFFNDANTPGAILPAVDDLFASIGFSPAGIKNFKFSIYGRNLLNEVNLGFNSSSATLPTGGFNQVSAKGRSFGLEATLDF
jgi:iron complex outermembrane receptor protein